MQRVIYSFQNCPVEFCVLDGEIFCFYSDFATPPSGSRMSEYVSLPDITATIIPKYIGKDNTAIYTSPIRGKHRKHKPSKLKPAVLISVTAMKAACRKQWRKRKGVNDVSDFLCFVQNDIFRKLGKPVGNPTKKPDIPQKKKQNLAPGQRKVESPAPKSKKTEQLNHASPEWVNEMMAKIDALSQEVHLLKQQDKRGFFARLFSRNIAA